MCAKRQQKPNRSTSPFKYAEYLMARALITVLQYLPLGMAYHLGRGAGWLAWETMRRRRSIVRKNLEIVHASLSRRALSASAAQQMALPLEKQVKEVFLRAGANLFCGFSFVKMNVGRMEGHIELEGIEFLESSLSGGRGAIVLLAHMGPWEALAQLPQLAQKYGVEAFFGAIYRPLNNLYLDRWYRRQRTARGTHLFGSRYKFYAPADFVRSGGLLGVLSDQRASGGEKVTYFGVRTSATPLPGLLHLRAKGGMLSVSISSLEGKRWRIRIRPVEISNTGSEGPRVLVAKQTAGAMEEVLSDSPLDGFWFHDPFKKSPKERENSALAERTDVARVT